jgi:choline dehydrogenase-like flavoprotein
MRKDGGEGSSHRQVVVIGSGFGGTMAAWPLVHQGVDVLMIERGAWVERGPENWSPEGTLTRTPYYLDDESYTARTDAGSKEVNACFCVGGPSAFYGGVSFRFREEDFLPNPEIVRDTGARWPFAYGALQSHYLEAERILGVAGRRGEDPTEPPRDSDYPAPPNPLSHVGRVMASAARSKGLRPFRLPLAINFPGSGTDRPACVECATCDTFACAISAKNDLSITVIPRLRRGGMELRWDTDVTRLHLDGSRVRGVECEDRKTGERYTVTADAVILAAGALASPHLILSSGLAEMNPAGEAVGRYLTRHCSAIVYGAYPWLPRYEGRFHKQIGINDYYLGDPSGEAPAGKLGNIQQTQTPSLGTVTGEVGETAGFLLGPLVRRITGLLVMAEDRPRYENRVFLEDGRAEGGRGRPPLGIEHRYDGRDLEARRLLCRRAREIHQAAGAVATYVHKIDTFSHALGTLRMGPDAEGAPVDREGRFRGVENLYVADGSALPTAAGVNPSLTIAANALRVGRQVRRASKIEAASAGRRG